MSKEKSPKARSQGNANKSNEVKDTGIRQVGKPSIVFSSRRSGISAARTHIDDMSGKAVSPTTQARRERQRLAAEEGAKAMAEYAAEAITVRKNMARLRALRLEKASGPGKAATSRRGEK